MPEITADVNDFSPSISNNTDISYKICDFPVCKETESAMIDFLQVINWKSLPKNTPKHGLIKGFVSDETNNQCVIVLNSIYYYEEYKCIAVYSFSTEGSYRIISDSNGFYVLFKRSKRVLQFDEKNNLTLYKLDIDSFSNKEWDRLGKIGLNGLTSTVAKGDFCISNQHPHIVPIISSAYDTFTWKGDVLYETSARMYLFIVIVVVNAIATSILLSLLIRHKKRVSRGRFS